jgi:hypothetical protein
MIAIAGFTVIASEMSDVIVSFLPAMQHLAADALLKSMETFVRRRITRILKKELHHFMINLSKMQTVTDSSEEGDGTES